MTLSAEDIKTIRETLVLAKFALEQRDEGPERAKALQKINSTLDLLRKA